MSLDPCSLDPRTLWVIVTCMGRLEFLRRSLPSVLNGFPGTYCLVDYGCPNGSGAWVESQYPEHVESGRIVIHRVEDVAHFHKADALNQGARRAVQGGAQQLCFLDADTLVLDGFWRWLVEHWDPAKFSIVALDALRSLFGVLSLSAEEFERSGGFDEAYRGWGNEDLEMRLRLHLARGLGYELIPARFLSAIPHGDELRTQHYAEKDKQRSFGESWTYTMSKVVRWTGCLPWELGPKVAVLMHPLESDVCGGRAAVNPELVRTATERPRRTERRFRRRIGRRGENGRS